ncbi:hypothetical protein BGZ49_008019 [Haplosporangium sp. Z 27]|nr:hypothetical protein BGZ49_008019 [Haplosporangium sp. Z 27]
MPHFEGVKTPTTSQTPIAVKLLNDEDKEKYGNLFQECRPIDGLISGDKVRALLLLTGLPPLTLAAIWDLADTQKRGALDLTEFLIAAYYSGLKDISCATLPNSLPKAVLDYCRSAAKELTERKGSSATHNPFSEAYQNPLLGSIYDTQVKEQQQQLQGILQAQKEQQEKFQKLIFDEAIKKQQEIGRMVQEKLGESYPQYMAGASPLYPTNPGAYLNPSGVSPSALNANLGQGQQNSNFLELLSSKFTNSNSDAYRILLEAFKGNDTFNINGSPNFGATTTGKSTTPVFSPVFTSPTSASLKLNSQQPTFSSPDRQASYSPIPQYEYVQPQLQQHQYPFHPSPMQQSQQSYYQHQHQHQQPLPHHLYPSPPVYQQQQYQQPYSQQYTPPPPSLYQQQQPQQHLSPFQSNSVNGELDPIKFASISVPAPVSATVTTPQPSHSPRAPQYYNPSPSTSDAPHEIHAKGTEQIHSRAPQLAHPEADTPPRPRAPQYREPITPVIARPF